MLTRSCRLNFQAACAAWDLSPKISCFFIILVKQTPRSQSLQHPLERPYACHAAPARGCLCPRLPNGKTRYFNVRSASAWGHSQAFVSGAEARDCLKLPLLWKAACIRQASSFPGRISTVMYYVHFGNEPCGTMNLGLYGMSRSYDANTSFQALHATQS